MSTIYFKGYDSQFKEFLANIETDKQHISFEKNGDMFYESFQDSIEKAQNQVVPVYIFAIAQGINDTFEIHDLYHLRRYLIQTYNTKNLDPLPEGIKAPESHLTIKKIHFFALPLFQSREKVESVEIKGNLEAIYIDPLTFDVDERESKQIADLAMDTCNYLLMEQLTEVNNDSPGLAFMILAHVQGHQDVLLNIEKSGLIEKTGGKKVWEYCSDFIFAHVHKFAANGDADKLL